MVRGFCLSLMRVSFFRLGICLLEEWSLNLIDEIGHIEFCRQAGSGSSLVLCRTERYYPFVYLLYPPAQWTISLFS